MNGEIRCYNVLTPWTWQEFKEAPDDICQEYLDRLVAVYDVNTAMLAMMFGKSKSMIYKHFINRGLKFSCHKGPAANETKAAWSRFIFPEQKENPNLSDASVTDFKGGTRHANENGMATQENGGEAATGLVEGSGGLLETDIALGMSGAFNESAFLEKIKRILPSDGEMVAIRIEIKTLKNLKGEKL